MRYCTRKRIGVAALLATLAAVVAWQAFPSVRVAVHSQQMQYWRSQYGSVDSESVTGVLQFHLFDPRTEYIYHRQKLVDLGVIAQRDYKFRHLQFGTDPMVRFLSSAQDSPLPHVDWEAPGYKLKSHFSVWCEYGDVPLWDSLIAKHDRRDSEQAAGDPESKVADSKIKRNTFDIF